jgi:hypothetical protein
MPATPGWGTITRQKFELTPEIIDEIKEELVKAGFEPRLFSFKNDGDTFVFRPLYFFDYAEIQAFVKANEGNIKQDDIDRKICEKSIVWPQEVMHPAMWEVQKAGLQSTLAKNVLARSGFIVDEIDQSAYMSVEPLVVVEHGPKPTDEVVQELKAKLNWPLYLVGVDNEWFVVRPISRAEWKALTSAENVDLDLMTAERVCVWSQDYPTPCDFSKRVAGTARTIAEVSMQFSGFNSRSTVEEL